MTTSVFFFFFQAEDGIRDYKVTGVQTCALPICARAFSGRSTDSVASERAPGQDWGWPSCARSRVGMAVMLHTSGARKPGAASSSVSSGYLMMANSRAYDSQELHRRRIKVRYSAAVVLSSRDAAARGSLSLSNLDTGGLHGYGGAEQHGRAAGLIVGAIVGQDVRVHAGMRERHGKPRVLGVVAPAMRQAHDTGHEVVGDFDGCDDVAHAARDAGQAAGTKTQARRVGRRDLERTAIRALHQSGQVVHERIARP